MKHTRIFWIELTILAFCLSAALASFAVYLNHGLDRENRLTARRIQHAFSPLISKAHRQKDDLMLQDIITALAQAPGIAYAAVLDPEGKIIAHSRLAQIGKPFHSLRGEGFATYFSLKESTRVWGALVFPLSIHSSDALESSLLMAAAACGGLLFAAYGFRLRRHAAVMGRLHADLQDLRLLLDENRLAAVDQQNSAVRMETETRASLAAALNRLPEAAILLDAQQRVLMANQAALSTLNITTELWSAGLSWQIVPLLQDCGAALEASLATPGRPVLWESGDRTIIGTLVTDVYDGMQRTWFTPRSALRASQ